MIIQDNKIYLDGSEDTLIACLIQCGVRVNKKLYDSKKKIQLTMGVDDYQYVEPLYDDVLCFVIFNLYNNMLTKVK